MRVAEKNTSWTTRAHTSFAAAAAAAAAADAACSFVLLDDDSNKRYTFAVFSTSYKFLADSTHFDSF